MKRLSTGVIELIRRYQDRHPGQFESTEGYLAYAGPVPGREHAPAEPVHPYAAHHD